MSCLLYQVLNPIPSLLIIKLKQQRQLMSRTELMKAYERSNFNALSNALPYKNINSWQLLLGIGFGIL